MIDQAKTNSSEGGPTGSPSSRPDQSEIAHARRLTDAILDAKGELLRLQAQRVEAMRSLLSAGWTLAAIAKLYGMSQSRVSHLLDYPRGRVGRPPRLEPHPAILSTREAAALLNYAPQTLVSWRRRGTGPKWTALGPGRRIGYYRDDLDKWMKGRNADGQAST